MTDLLTERAVAHPRLPAAAIDLGACELFEIAVGLLDFEKPALDYATWPEAVRGRIARIVAEWQTRNPARVIRAITTAIARDDHDKPTAAVMLLHHTVKR